VGILPMEDTALNRARCPSTLPRLLAQGLPVIAHDVGEVATYLDDGRAGRRIPPNDDRAFVDALLGVIEYSTAHPGTRGEISRQTLQRWSWDRLAGELDLAYQQSLVYK